jgi:predicted GNAT family N-acyltransferase
MLSEVTDADFEIRERLEPSHVTQLMELYAAEWWTSERQLPDVEAMLAGTDLVVAVIHRPSERLVGFARVLTDFVYQALVLDVIVAADLRGTGLGARLMDAIVGHPKLASLRTIELACQPELVAFYERWGFTDKVGRSRLMRRTSDPRLAGG